MFEKWIKRVNRAAKKSILDQRLQRDRYLDSTLQAQEAKAQESKEKKHAAIKIGKTLNQIESRIASLFQEDIVIVEGLTEELDIPLCTVRVPVEESMRVERIWIHRRVALDEQITEVRFSELTCTVLVTMSPSGKPHLKLSTAYTNPDFPNPDGSYSAKKTSGGLEFTHSLTDTTGDIAQNSFDVRLSCWHAEDLDRRHLKRSTSIADAKALDLNEILEIISTKYSSEDIERYAIDGITEILSMVAFANIRRLTLEDAVKQYETWKFLSTIGTWLYVWFMTSSFLEKKSI